METLPKAQIKFVEDAWSAVVHSPSWMIIGMVLIVVAFCIQKSQSIGNKWIPIVYVLGGLILLPLLGDRKSIPADQQNPILLMCLLGVILGFGTYVAHFSVYKLLRNRIPEGFFPPDESNNAVIPVEDRSSDKPPTP
jgi:hypothetical protein